MLARVTKDYAKQYSGEAPKPTGKQAAAKKAAAALVTLLANQARARWQVTTVRGEATS